jgi:hypothetical protein
MSTRARTGIIIMAEPEAGRCSTDS